MPVLLQCECGQQLKVADEHIGKRVKCPGCARIQVAQTQQGQAQPEPAPPAALRFRCACGRELQARAEFAGRSTRCPSCGATFRIPGESASDTSSTIPSQPAPGARPGRDDEGERAAERAGDVPPAKVRRGRVAGRRVWPWAAAAASVVLLVGLGIAYWFLRTAPAADLNFVPADALGFATVRVAEFVDTPLWLEILRQGGDPMTQGLGALEAKVGMKLADIERTTVVVKEMPAPDTAPSLWVVVTANRSWDQQKLLDALEGPEEKKHGRFTCYIRDNKAIYLPTPKTVVFAPTEEALKECMAQQESPRTQGPRARALKEGAGKSQIVLGVAAPRRLETLPGIPQLGDVASLLEVQSIIVAASVNGMTAEAEMIGAYANGEKARAARETLEELRAAAVNKVVPMLQQQAPQAAERVQKELGNLKITQSGADVVVSTRGRLDPADLGGQTLLKNLVGDVGPRLQSRNNLHRLGLAAHNYLAAHGEVLPTSIWRCPENSEPYSWRVALLPYLEEEALYQEIVRNGAWNSPANRRLAERMPKVYVLPGKPAALGMTYYKGFTGEGMPLGPTAVAPGQRPQAARMPGSFQDGTSNTILFVEAATPVNWMEPGSDLPFVPRARGYSPLSLGDHWGNNRFQVALADGSVHALSRNLNPLTLQALITPRGGEVIPPDFDR
jgi:hypothetical protein